MDYCIKLEEFEGPLDLLLHLVKQSNVDIHKINISEITDQYMKYINKLDEININNSSDYLVMAATLMEIKSKSLIPNDSVDEEIEDIEDPKEVLIEKLIEYQKYKEITKDFKELELDRRNIYTKAPMSINNFGDKKIVNDTGVTAYDLMRALVDFQVRKNMEKPVVTKVTNKEYSVVKRKKDIKNYLSDKGIVKFTDLFDECSKSYIVVTFMSILELANEDDIVLRQDKNFDDILIELKVK